MRKHYGLTMLLVVLALSRSITGTPDMSQDNTGSHAPHATHEQPHFEEAPAAPHSLNKIEEENVRKDEEKIGAQRGGTGETVEKTQNPAEDISATLSGHSEPAARQAAGAGAAQPLSPGELSRLVDLYGNPPPVENVETIHFLLWGRPGGEADTNIMLIVSLSPESHARLTGIPTDIAVPHPAGRGQVCHLRELQRYSGSHAGVLSVVEQITGFNLDFYIELDTDGFIKMVDIMGGINMAPDGASALNFLLTAASAEQKERLIVQLLCRARDLDMTRTGWQLILTGLRHIRTDLSLNDLIKLRRVTQKIAPETVTYEELPVAPAHCKEKSFRVPAWCLEKPEPQ